MLKWFTAKEPKKEKRSKPNGLGDLEKLVEEITEIPTLPDIVFKVTEVINDPKSSASDLERTLSHDQAIVSKILKLVNSAYYKRREKIASLGRAIPILGFQNIRNLVFSMSLLEFSTDEIDMRAFWRHSFATSLIANEIAKHNKIDDMEAAGCAALIHDLGKVILYQHYPGEFIKITSKVSNGDTTFFEAENTAFGVNHAQIGKMLGEKWGFPPSLIAPIEFHHSPMETSEHPTLVAVVYLANIISDRYGYGFLSDSSMHNIEPDLAERFLTGDELKVAVEAKLKKEMPIFETFIDKMAAFRQSIEDHDREIYEPTDVWSP
jgi:putative nucleotidyltransferase with HDIG domain